MAISTKRDLALAATWLAIGLVLLALGAMPVWSQVAILPVSLATASLRLTFLAGLATLRSRFPLPALALAAPIAVLDVLHGGTPGVLLVVSDLIYATVKYASAPQLRSAVKVGLALALAGLLGLIIARPPAPVYQLSAQWVLIIAISIMWGWNVRSERVRTQELLTERHRRQRADLQSQIAHDLHDLVANHIAVAGLHIEAARMLAADPPVSSALAKAKVGTDHAHAELRTLIAVLAGDDAGASNDDGARPGATFTPEDLLPAGRTIQWTPHRQATVDLLTAGEGPVPGIIARVLFEAVANAVKHGQGDIGVEVTDSQVSITNTSTGPFLPTHLGSGRGLRGATRLMRGIGGDLSFRREDDGTWRTTITLPKEIS